MRHSWSKALVHLWQIINPLWVFIIINSYSSTSKEASWRGRLSFCCWLGSVSKRSWQQNGTPYALQAFSRQEHIPPPFATLNANSQRSDRIMWSQREAPEKLFYLPWLFLSNLPQAVLSPFTTCLDFIHNLSLAVSWVEAQWSQKPQVYTSTQLECLQHFYISF